MIFFGGIRNFLRGWAGAAMENRSPNQEETQALPPRRQTVKRPYGPAAVGYPSGPGGGGSDSSNSFKFSLLTTAVPVSMREGSG